MNERRFYLLLGSLALVLASLPYLYGWLKTPAGLTYSGLTSNIDDCLVYFSWMVEVGRGHPVHHNLFSTETQDPKLFYAWFWFLGKLARVLGELPQAFHVGRLLGGGLLLWAVVGLLQETLTDTRARKAAFALVCFSSGFGWLFGGYNPARGFTLQPIDTFQPEAITFLSLYYSPLFAPMTAAMVFFITALRRAVRTERLADIWPACVAGALLGNSHTYDIIPLFAVSLVWLLIERRFTLKAWLPFVVAFGATFPTTAYTAWASRVDPLFRARAWTNEGTWTPAPWWVLLGFGLPLLFAMGTLVRAKGVPSTGTPSSWEGLLEQLNTIRNRSRDAFRDRSARRLLLAWAIVGLLVAYLPFPFQRKLLMGVHLPLCLLGGVGLSRLVSRLSGDFPKIALFFAVVLSSVSNVLYLLADIGRLDTNAGTTAHRPYLSEDEHQVLAYLHDHGVETDAVLVAPDPSALRRYPNTFQPHLSGYIAVYGRKRVYNGHWSETLNYPAKNAATLRFFREGTDDEVRKALLKENHIRYVVYVNPLAGADLAEYHPVDWLLGTPPAYLAPVLIRPSLTVFRVSEVL